MKYCFYLHSLFHVRFPNGMHISGSCMDLLLQKASGAVGNGERLIIPWWKEVFSLLEDILVHAMSWYPQQKPGRMLGFTCCPLYSWLHLQLFKFHLLLAFFSIVTLLGLSRDCSCSPAAGFCRRILFFLCSFSPSLFPSGLFPFVSFSQQWPATHNQLHSCSRNFLLASEVTEYSLVCHGGTQESPGSLFLSSATLFSDRTLQTSCSLTRANSQISLVSPLSPDSSLQRWEITPFSSPQSWLESRDCRGPLYHLQASTNLSLPTTTCSSADPQRSKVSFPKGYQSHGY